MAYIYEFAFLCDNLVDANRIMYLLAEDTWPGLGGCFANIGEEQCYISVNHHDFISGEKTNSSLYWVSVIPYHKHKPGPGYVSEHSDKIGIKWPSGGFPTDEDKKQARLFERAMEEKMLRWPFEVRFIYACPGFEVSGFRNKKEIFELPEDYPPHLSYIKLNVWSQAGRPHNWEFINHHILKCLPPYEG